MIPIFVFFLFISKAFSEDCTLDVSDPETPFIVTNTLKFPKYDDSTKQTFTFTKEQLFYAVCPRGTESPFLGEKGDHLACKDGTQLLNIRTIELIDFDDIKCKSSGVTTVTKSDEKCASTGTTFEIGLSIYTKFISMITVCFDETKLTPIYTKYNNMFNGSITQLLAKTSEYIDNYYRTYICDGTDCGWVDSGETYGTTNIDSIYTNQADIFENLKVDTSNITLLRFPLSAMTVWYLNVKKNNGQEIQKVPYYDYINVVPAWDFALLDAFFYVLNTTVGSGEDVGSIIYTGTLGVATLPNEDGDDVELYLDGDKVPVPKWFWVAWDKAEKIFFYYNHPNWQETENAIAQVCSQHDFVTTSMVTCYYDSVLDPQLKQIIDNDLK